MKDKIIIIGFYFILIFFLITSLFDTNKSISKIEKRKLAEKPKYELFSLTDSTFYTKLNNYTTDHFPYRDYFLKVKTKFANIVYQKYENHDTYVINDTIYQLNFTINNNSISYFTNKLNEIQNKYFSSKKVYYAIIPDKNYYITNQSIPKIDYEQFFNLVHNNLNDSFIEIDLKDSLSLDSYYKTDIHWKQEALEPIIKTIQNSLNLQSTSYPNIENTFYPFYGAYYAKNLGSTEADTLKYLSSQTIENTTVYNYEKKEIQSVYNDDNLNNIDSYDIFLDGPTPILILENKSQTNNRELIIFRDSFASSLAPLLIENYNKITLIDIRYINSNLLDNIQEINFTKQNQDILFLYSIPIINQSFTLK